MKIKLFGNVAMYLSWSMAIGFFIYYLSMLGALAYVLFIIGGPGGFGQFVSIPSFILVFGVGIGFTIMRKHTLKENELGKALKEDFVFAGWIGLLVTMLNLLPIGQLDGGHVAYAMLGEKQKLIGQAAFILLVPLSFLSINWLVWGLLLLLLMRTVKHPPIQDIHIPLSESDKRIGYICLLIFILCFIPAPFKI